jgi:hypothetical protein
MKITNNKKNNNKISKKIQKIIKYLTIFDCIFLLFIIFNKNPYNNILNIDKINEINSNYIKDDITLVSAFYKIKSKHSFIEYMNWIENFFQINRSIVFFVDKYIYKEIIRKRPKKYQYKTIWIKVDITDFYSYKYFLKEFKESYELDFEKKIHSVPLYLIWAEKCNFLKIAAIKNFFKSKCFYWVDAGCFREKKEISKFTQDWPSTQNCLEDGRVIFNEIRHASKLEIIGLKNFNSRVHINFQHYCNIDGSMFGGGKKSTINFCNLYYKTIKLFVKNKIFIGNDQNLFAFIAYMNKGLVKLVYSGKWFYLQYFLSKKDIL